MPQLQAPSSAASPCSAALRSDEAATAHLTSASTAESRRSAEMLTVAAWLTSSPGEPTSTLRQARAQGRRAHSRAFGLDPCKARDALRATAATRTMRTSHARSFVPHVRAPTTVSGAARRLGLRPPLGRAGPGLQHHACCRSRMAHPLASTRVRRTLGFSCEGPTFTGASAQPSRHESMPQHQAPSTAASPCSAARSTLHWVPFSRLRDGCSGAVRGPLDDGSLPQPRTRRRRRSGPGRERCWRCQATARAQCRLRSQVRRPRDA